MTDRFIEFRLYKLKPGVRDKFHAIALEVREMLERHKITVVGHGPSSHDADSYFLMRAFPSLEAREKALNAFYGSDEWAKRFNAKVTGMIESYNTIVLDASDPAVRTIARLAG